MEEFKKNNDRITKMHEYYSESLVYMKFIENIVLLIAFVFPGVIITPIGL